MPFQTTSSPSAWLSLSDPSPLFFSEQCWWRPIPREWDDLVRTLEGAALPILAGKVQNAEAWTRVVEREGPWGHVEPGEVVGCLVHEAPTFLSYPSEWTADQWYAVAQSSLELTRSLKSHGLRLKRFSPWDFHLREGQPVFHNWFQIEEAPDTEAAVPGFPSFLQGMLYPLLAHNVLGWEPRLWATTFPQGIPPERLYRAGGWGRRFLQPFLSLVCLPHWMHRWTRRRSSPPRTTVGRAKKAVDSLHHQMSQWLKRVRPRLPPAERADRSNWKVKEQALERWVKTHRPKLVGDLYCRSGHLAKGVARLGPKVVALDPSEARVRRADPKGVDFMVMDLATPSVSQAIGVQPLGFVHRFRHHWDMVVVTGRWLHHWRDSRGLPPSTAFALLHQLSRHWVVFEAYPVGSGVERLGLESLRDLLGPWFTVEDSVPVGSGELWLLRAKPSPTA